MGQRAPEPSGAEADAMPAEEPTAPALAEPSAGGDNQPPRLMGISIDPLPPLVAGQVLRIDALARDPEGEAIEFQYQWILNDAEIEHEGPRYDTRDLKRGDVLKVRVVASDGWSESAPIESPAMTVVNAAPRVLSQPGGAEPDGSFRYEVRAEDPDGDTELSYRLEQGPEGMEISSATGLLSWRPGADQYGKVQRVKIAVVDPEGGAGHQEFDLTIEAPAS